MPFQISEALDTVLNKHEKRLFMLFLLAISTFFGMIIFVSIGIWHYAPLEQRVLLSALWLFAVMISAFVISSYLFGALFKTKRSLRFLIQETLHELNVPLSVIKANLAMLLTAEKDPKKCQRLERIVQASDDLHRLYTEVDYYIKREIRSETKELFDVVPVIVTILTQLRDVNHDIHFNVEVSSLTLFADKHGLAKVFTNLLTNAIKYNQEHRPIHISQEQNTLIIRDEGIGMSEAELFLVFDRYYQANSAHEGFGIGLNLVKAYCDEHKIILSIHSQKGKGTTIRLNLSNLVPKK
jgi:signal transduction histidine kinase